MNHLAQAAGGRGFGKPGIWMMGVGLWDIVVVCLGEKIISLKRTLKERPDSLLKYHKGINFHHALSRIHPRFLAFASLR